MKRHLILMALLAAVLGAGSCGGGEETPPPTPRPKEKTLTIAAYNVATFNSMPELWPSGTFATVGNMMKELKADIVCLNEVDKYTSRSQVSNQDQAKRFAEEMGGSAAEAWDYCFGPGLDPHPTYGGQYGDAMVSRTTANKKTAIKLPKGQVEGAEERALVIMEFDDCIVMATHLEHLQVNDALRQLQMKAINEYVEANYKDYAKPVFIAGDFNAKPDSESMTYMQERWKIISVYGPNYYTYPADNPNRTIDYVLALRNDAEYRVSYSTVPSRLNSGDVTKVSDHRPVVVEIKLPLKEGEE